MGKVSRLDVLCGFNPRRDRPSGLKVIAFSGLGKRSRPVNNQLSRTDSSGQKTAVTESDRVALLPSR